MKIEVSQDALRTVLEAVVGPPHLIRELQATMSIHNLVPNAIVTLTNEYNDAIKKAA
jgi:hypothetical protein